MSRVVSFVFGCFLCFCLFLATERRLMALYVDPGSGLLVMQSAASAIAAIGFFLRRRIRALFSRREKTKASVPMPAEKGSVRNVC
jgi:hypothetical protein